MTQTYAIFYDAYRELNAKKMFWIVMIISALVVAAFAALGINKEGVSFLVWTIDIPMVNSDLIDPATFYKGLFEDWGIGIWLSWVATILALISTASIFPEFIAGGAIELTLAKPIGRLRLFLTKYVAGMLFVTLQVTVFSLASFLVIGFRGHFWEPRLFLAIPIVAVLFSYLFSVCVLLGLLTRSTIAALLLTLLFWFFVFILNAADAFIVQGEIMNSLRQERLTANVARYEAAAMEKLDAEAATPPTPDAPPPDAPPPDAPSPKAASPGTLGEYTPEQLEAASPSLAGAKEELETVTSNGRKWRRAETIAIIVKTAFPKTGETVGLLGRTLKSAEELEKAKKRAETLPVPVGRGVNQRELENRMEEKYRGRTTAWVLGTSLAFEFVVLGLAALIFCRRDF